DEVAAGAVEGIGEAAGLAGHGPAGGADGLLGVVGEIDETAFIENLSLREIFGEERPVFGNPVEHLAAIGNVFGFDDGVIVDEAEAGHTVQRDHPEPAAFAAEMVGREEIREAAELLTLAMEQNFLVRMGGELFEIDLTIDPAPCGAVADSVFLFERERAFEDAGAA